MGQKTRQWYYTFDLSIIWVLTEFNPSYLHLWRPYQDVLSSNHRRWFTRPKADAVRAPNPINKPLPSPSYISNNNCHLSTVLKSPSRTFATIYVWFVHPDKLESCDDIVSMWLLRRGPWQISGSQKLECPIASVSERNSYFFSSIPGHCEISG